jgi:hypothetical protein
MLKALFLKSEGALPMKFIKGMLILTLVVFAANVAFAIDPIPKDSG